MGGIGTIININCVIINYTHIITTVPKMAKLLLMLYTLFLWFRIYFISELNLNVGF